ncbi:MAG: type II toxin-antitoxin system RelE/ParE family toxin [Limnobacter sp.]|nr:type II toxin-antitoxin system RelE/ParE family toxin [Limnobacter sp.]
MKEKSCHAFRVFKTRWFSKAAKKESISDSELCLAITQVLNGQAENLGGGVFKKRLNKNMHRALLLTQSKNHWVYAYLFAKNQRQNIDDLELIEFRKLADLYSLMSDKDIAKAVMNKEWIEICHDKETEIQK